MVLHIRTTNIQLWKPRKDIAIDESIIRFIRRAKEILIIPTKPTLEGIKVWSETQWGYMLWWDWHRPGKKHGPIGVVVPKLPKDQTINKTQVVVPHLLSKLPLTTHTYHVYLDNLFTSTNFLLYFRHLGYGATGTCCTSSGIIAELVETKRVEKD